MTKRSTNFTGKKPIKGGRIEMSIDQLLADHAAAWWRDTHADDFVEQVNQTYNDYLAAGGNDAHYDVNWRRMSDAAKRARPLSMDGTDYHHEGEC